MKKPIRIKILVVDDKENNLLSLESIFDEDKYYLTKASSGKEALKILLKEWDFALILMDVEMPDMNGFEAASLIYTREKLKHIPIIFITAHSYGDDNVFKGYRAGAVDYIYKPIQPEILRTKVHVFVELYKKTQQLIAQEEKLIGINRSLEIEINDRIASEEKVKELNKQLLQNISQLETTNKELDCFAYMASHDLQEPLRKIKIFSERIVSKNAANLDEEAMSYMSKIQSACTRMQNLINDIFAFSKIAVTKDSDMKVYSDMNHILEEVIADMDITIQEKNVKVIVDKLPKMHVYPNLMKALFQNLISNSIKYSQKNIPPVIRITSKIDSFVRSSEKELHVKKYCRIYIEDNGVGFDQQYAEQIFTMFKRLHIGQEYEGTGIGLAICKKIVEEHQGYISAQSTVNKGTTFVISLPVEQLPATTKTGPIEKLTA